ncbi:MAG: hypothetical protein PHF00_03000 [Elusimicrobia bacterium]|nr:hypothetical protein [Elusimicrobiota bacterium]
MRLFLNSAVPIAAVLAALVCGRPARAAAAKLSGPARAAAALPSPPALKTASPAVFRPSRGAFPEVAAPLMPAAAPAAALPPPAAPGPSAALIRAAGGERLGPEGETAALTRLFDNSIGAADPVDTGDSGFSWAVLEQWLAGELDFELKPGRTGPWAARARDMLRNDPGRPWEEALAEALAAEQGLSAAQREQLRSALAGGDGRLRWPMRIDRFIAGGGRVYAFEGGNLHVRQGRGWKLIASGIVQVSDRPGPGGKLLACRADELYELDGETLTPVIAGRFNHGFNLLEKEGGPAVLSNRYTELHQFSASGWKALPAVGFGPGDAARWKGSTYLAMKDGLYRLEGGRWGLAGLAGMHVSELFAVGGRLYALAYPGNGRQELLELLEGGRAYRTVIDADVRQAVAHGGALYAAARESPEDSAGAWYEIADATARRIAGMHRFVWQRGRVWLKAGADLYIQTDEGPYRIRAGVWMRQEAPPGKARDYFVDAVERGGRRYLALNDGVFEVSGDSWRLLAQIVPESLAVDDRGVYVKSAHSSVGALRFGFEPEGLSAHWREALLGSLGDEIKNIQRKPAALPAPYRAAVENGDIVGEDEKPLFTGLGRWLGGVRKRFSDAAQPPEAADVWPRLRRWTEEETGIALPAARTRAWASAAAAKLREDPTRDLAEVMAEAFAETARLPRTQKESVRQLFALGTALPAAVDKLVLARGRTYAFTAAGLYVRFGSAWRLVHPGIRAEHGVQAGPEGLFAGDGNFVYLVKGGAARAMLETAVRSFKTWGPFAGMRYLAGGVFAFYQRAPGLGWRKMKDGLWNVFAVDEIAGRVYAFSQEGSFRLEAGRWVRMLPTRSGGYNFAKVFAHGGRILGWDGKRLFGWGLDHDPLAEPRLLLDGVSDAFAHGGRLYAVRDDAELIEREGGVWKSLFPLAERERAACGDDLYVRARRGVLRRGRDGRWTPQEGDIKGPLRLVVEFSGRRFAADDAGILEARGDGWLRLASAPGVTALVADAEGVFYGTARGLFRLGGAPADWRSRVLSSVAEIIEERQRREGIEDRGGWSWPFGLERMWR